MSKCYLPIMLDVSAKSLLIIGGGAVACQKLRALRMFTDNITVLAKDICAEIADSQARCIYSEYQQDVLREYAIVYACTDDASLNHKISVEAKRMGCMVNVVDNSELSDFISPAVYKQEDMVVAVSSQGTDVRRAIKWCDAIARWMKLDE